MKTIEMYCSDNEYIRAAIFVDVSEFEVSQRFPMCSPVVVAAERPGSRANDCEGIHQGVQIRAGRTEAEIPRGFQESRAGTPQFERLFLSTASSQYLACVVQALTDTKYLVKFAGFGET